MFAESAGFFLDSERADSYKHPHLLEAFCGHEAADHRGDDECPGV